MGQEVFRRAAGFERVVFASDEAAGLRSIIAVHSTRLGPALGGCRIQPYTTEDAALDDVLRLAEAMTWKAAAAGLDFGGGKAVVLADPERDKGEALLRAFGRVVESLDGRYITSVDVGTTTPDLDEIAKETRWVVGVSPHHGGGGDPSEITARGVLGAIHSCLYTVRHDTSLEGRRVAVQGVGKVGYHLARLCREAGAEVVVADPDVDNLGRAIGDLGVDTISPDEILSLDCDVLAPCALGGVLDAETISRLAAPIVCGAANNQLASADDARRLMERDILHAPDFIVNAGGLISVADELDGWNRDRVLAKVDRIGRTLLDVFHLATESGIPPYEAAVAYAKERIETLSGLAR